MLTLAESFSKRRSCDKSWLGSLLGFTRSDLGLLSFKLHALPTSCDGALRRLSVLQFTVAQDTVVCPHSWEQNKGNKTHPSTRTHFGGLHICVKTGAPPLEPAGACSKNTNPYTVISQIRGTPKCILLVSLQSQGGDPCRSWRQSPLFVWGLWHPQGTKPRPIDGYVSKWRHPLPPTPNWWFPTVISPPSTKRHILLVPAPCHLRLPRAP